MTWAVCASSRPETAFNSKSKRPFCQLVCIVLADHFSFVDDIQLPLPLYDQTLSLQFSAKCVFINSLKKARS